MEASSRNTMRRITIPVTEKNRRKAGILLREKRAVAKAGMAGSLGALFASGFFRFPGAKSLHVYSGFGLLAFTVWHHFLNKPNSKPKRL